MDTRSKNISFVPVLRFLAALLAISGAIVACWGLTEAPNFRYAFEPEAFDESIYKDSALQDGLHWVSVLTNKKQQEERMYQHAVNKLSSPYPYLYHAKPTGQEVITNVKGVSNIDAFFSSLPSYTRSTLINGGTVYVGFSAETHKSMVENFARDREKGIVGIYLALGGFVLMALGLGYVMYSAGDIPGSSEIHLSVLDRLYLDVGLAITIGIGIIAVGSMVALSQEYYRHNSQVVLVLGALLAGGATLAALQYSSSVAKRMKRREFIRHTLLYASCRWVFTTIGHLWNIAVTRTIKTGSLALRAAGCLIAYSIGLSISLLILILSHNPITALFGLGMFGLVSIVALIFVVGRASELKAVITGTGRIKAGDLACRIPESGSADFVALASNVNNIALGLQAAVENEVKSERMKAELVTNVSHDLKTPLTSIITYVDLLKTEGLESENAPRYLEVLDHKTQRLKVLTEDLFEAAKAASGNMAVKLEKLDIGSLLTQGLAELSDRIEASGLDFRVSTPADKLYVRADGRLLWRAIENVIGNALKYALPGSRVYVEAVAKAGKAHLTFKNISATPLNIPPEELVERFKRGDESRSTEGSGLGLSIAKSLVELNNGTFRIDIDGDLFKVTIAFPEY